MFTLLNIKESINLISYKLDKNIIVVFEELILCLHAFVFTAFFWNK